MRGQGYHPAVAPTRRASERATGVRDSGQCDCAAHLFFFGAKAAQLSRPPTIPKHDDAYFCSATREEQEGAS